VIFIHFSSHELQVVRDAIGQMGWDTNSVTQHLRTKWYWRSRPIIDNAMTQLPLSQERGITVPIVTATRPPPAKWRKLLLAWKRRSAPKHRKMTTC
jgi:hypothetical protein